METISTEQYPVYIGNDSVDKLNEFLSGRDYTSVFILADENTKKHCLPKLKKEIPLHKIIQIKSGEKSKNIRTCEKIWKELSTQNSDRKSVLVNLGGGVISDIGGFAASTYKRGIDFINIPTTLLAQADASVGGKTGIDFMNFKNQIGTFSFPKAVFVIPDFLKTLNKRELLSGFSEVIKHGLIADRDYWKKIKTPLFLSPKERGLHAQVLPFGEDLGGVIISRSIEIKNKIVTADPYENGVRKILNFGHTIGHAIESASLKTKKHLLHGEAIAIGMICEVYLSRKCKGLSSEELDEITSFIISVFNPKPVTYPVKNLIALMKQDKKNKNEEINFTLLSCIGKAEINNSCTEELIEESIKFFNERLAPALKGV